MSVGESIAQSFNTSGRVVVFTGLAVVALLGMRTLNVGILKDMAIDAATTIVLTVVVWKRSAILVWSRGCLVGL
jgi:uncharacterized membrane protein YdfJ with MMPL/SSD domain